MPLWQRMREILLGLPRLFVDETRAPVLDPGRGRTKTGYFWSIARDDRAWRGGTGPPGVVHTYAPRRGERCARNHWEGLSCFLEDGRIEIDSNVVERSMRPIALKETLKNPTA